MTPAQEESWRILLDLYTNFQDGWCLIGGREGKRTLLTGAASDDLFLAAWPGQWSQDVFEVDNIDDVRSGFGLTR
jgi:hypothetical protein